MKANELRIGNYYQYAGDNGIIYTKVKEIKHNQFGLLGDFDGVNFEICKPIKLTEEWLLKFGFEYKKHYNNYVIKAKGFYNSVGYNDEDGDWYYNNDSSNAGCYYITSIYYVHQLQNLYFALTGEELIYKI